MSRFPYALPLAILTVATLAACSNEEATAPAPMASNAGETASQSESAPMDAHPAPTPATVSVDLTGIAKAEGGQTVAGLYAAKDQLEGETVAIRGKVVKVNAGIMGKNWLHVRDGSGEEGSNDLTVTTTGAIPAVGDTVLVSGAVGLNRDFGMGYTYPLILEDADVTVEAAAQ